MFRTSKSIIQGLPNSPEIVILCFNPLYLNYFVTVNLEINYDILQIIGSGSKLHFDIKIINFG